MLGIVEQKVGGARVPEGQGAAYVFYVNER